MFKRLTIKSLLLIAATCAAVWLPSVVWRDNLPAFLIAPYAVLRGIPPIPVYILNAMGVPGLLQNNGHCGWGWCAPTVFGYVTLATFWVAVAWLVARFISILTNKRRLRERNEP